MPRPIAAIFLSSNLLFPLAILCLPAGFLHALEPAVMQAMVIVEGDQGRGSAFVVRMDGKSFLVTNSHVVRGNRNLKFKTLQNVDLVTRPLQIAEKVDAVRCELPSAAQGLELMGGIEQKIKIGDEIVVAGNAEGEGVVREISGKIVGIGPDRIEVDAGFVPGNSGSPILLKSTGEVIGVATYLKIPWQTRTSVKSATSLNEVRRFGYRLDTVTRWISPSEDHLLKEGLKLAEMEALTSAVATVMLTNADYVAKFGSSSLVSKDQREKHPAIVAVAAAVDEFVAKKAAPGTSEERKRNVTELFDKLRAAAAAQTEGLKEEHFSGFFAVQFKEQMARRKILFDRFEGSSLSGYADFWLAGSGGGTLLQRTAGPKIDPAKFKVTLSNRNVPSEPADNRNHVSYPPEMEPPSLEGICWVIEDPKNVRTVQQMHRSGLRVRTPFNGTYRVYVEYRGDANPVVVSNVIELRISDVTSPVATSAEDRAKPLAEFLGGTKWLWYGGRGKILEFRPDGKIDFDDWTGKGLVTGWKSSGPNQVKLTILKGRTSNMTAVLNFAEDRSSFTGIDFSGKSQIAKSPRVASE